MACDDLITNQDLENAKKDATTMSDFVESDSPEIQSKNGKNIRTLQGINDAADNLISSLGGTDIGDYEDDLTLNSYNEYVVFDRAGATTGPSLWKAIPPRTPTPGTPLPYTIDSATYPDPTNDPNIEPFSDINKAGAEQIAQEEANAGDSQLAGGNIWPLSSQKSAQVGDSGLVDVLFLNDASTKTRFLLSRTVSGGITALDFVARTATIGGQTLTMNPLGMYDFPSVADAMTAELSKIGAQVRTFINLGGVQSVQYWTVTDAEPTGSSFGVATGVNWLELNIPESMTLADVGGVPESINPTFDNLTAWNRIQDLDVDIYFDDYYAVDGTARIKNVIGKKINGKGINKCGFIGLDNSVEVFNTYIGSGTATTKEASYTNFGVKGVGTAAFVWAHVTTSYINQVGIQDFVGIDGHVFEYGWANTVGSIYSNGANCSGAPIKFNAGWLDTSFSHIYTSNPQSDHCFVYDSTVIEYSNPGAGGNGINVINLLTLQGANVSAMRIPAGRTLTVNQLYTENNESIFDIGSDGNAVSDMHFSGSLEGIRSATSTRIGLLDGRSTGNINNVTFSDFAMYDLPIEVGKITVGVNFDWVRVRNNTPFESLIRRNANTPTTMPMTARYQSTHESKMMMKTNGFQYRFAILEVDNNGAWVPTILDIPLA